VQRPSFARLSDQYGPMAASTSPTRTDAPECASSDPARPSPDEAMTIASVSTAYTGTDTLDESTKTVHANIEASTFPNFVRAPNHRRSVTSIADEELKLHLRRISRDALVRGAAWASKWQGRYIASSCLPRRKIMRGLKPPRLAIQCWIGEGYIE
jgi:Lipocalin-like domain